MSRELADLDRPHRKRRLRAGQVRPRNLAEWELSAADWKQKREPDGS